MQWFQIKEQSAGKKRLILSWYLYKIFGKKILYVIAFLVSFFTFVFASKVRSYSKKYFTISYPYIKIKPNLLSQFKHIYSYAASLADKILVYCNDYDSKQVVFKSEQNKKIFFDDIKKGNGIFLICNHIGNVEILQSHFFQDSKKYNFNVNIFISRIQSQIFREFLDTIKVDFPVKLFPVEEMSIDTGIKLKENLSKGDIVFISGDRLSQNNDKYIEEKVFEHTIFLPRGAFKLAKLMNVPTYFVSVIKNKKEYEIYMERQEDLSEKVITRKFATFLEDMIKVNPFQFFHFYDFFSP